MNRRFFGVVAIYCLLNSVANAESFADASVVDFCGVQNVAINSDPFVGRPRCSQTAEMHGTADSLDVFRRLSADTVDDVIFIHPVQAFHDIVVVAEREAFNGDRDAFFQYAQSASLLLTAYENVPRLMVPWQTIDCMKAKYEYMIARIINARQNDVIRLSPEDVRKMLGMWTAKGMTAKANSKIELRKMRAHMNFCRMLIVGAAIEDCLVNNGELPLKLEKINGLQANETIDVFGNQFEYRTDGIKWRLACGEGAPKDSSDVDLCIPAMDFSGLVTERIWFSSNYSQLRRKLFMEGAINTDKPGFRCYLNKSKTAVSVEHNPNETAHPIPHSSGSVNICL